MEIQIETALLKAAMLATSKEETRYYLKGVYFELRGLSFRMVATDGHRMFVACQNLAHPIGDNWECVLPFDGLKKALTGIPAKQEFVTLSYGRLQSTLNNVVLEPIDCTYPDFKRVVPEKISGDVAQFNPVYVGEFGKIAKLVSGSRGSNAPCFIQHNGNGPAIISFDRDDCFGVLMPMRPKDDGGLNRVAVNLIVGRDVQHGIPEKELA